MKQTQSDQNIPNNITLENILDAVKDYENNTVEHSFKKSRDYDVIINNKPYPPKAIIGLASRYIIGKPLKPAEFSAGLDKKCFKILKEFGFEIRPKNVDLQTDIIPGTIFSNNELCDQFLCAPQGGMRKSNRTNSLILIMNHKKSLYEDRWKNDILFYTGMGQEGDQVLNGNQNLTLYNSNVDHINVFLFEVLKEKEYTFIGQVYLENKPFQEIQPDIHGQKRKVWIFPLKILNDQNVVESKTLQDLQNEKEKQVSKLTDEEIEKRAQEQTSTYVGFRKTTTKTYQRNPYVVEYAKRKAKGICDLCNKPAPFNSKDKQAYLEVHHVIQLSKGGPDTITNVVALCPNCHRKMHIIEDKKDISFLQDKINKRNKT